MKVSIITVTYNSEATLEETLQSVFSQTYQDIEYIVIDGQSADRTIEILTAHKDKISTLVSEKDHGLYDAINKGLALATGEIVGILHSDDFYLDEHVIADYVKTFEKSGADAVYADLYYVERTATDKIVRKWKSGAYHTLSFLRGWMPPHPTFFVRRSCYENFGNFDVSFKTAADYELMLRFAVKHGIQLAYLPRYTVKMRTGGASNVSLKNRLKANLDDRRAWQKNGLTPHFYTLHLKPLRKLVQYFLK